MTHFMVIHIGRKALLFLLEDPTVSGCPFSATEVTFEGIANPLNPVWHNGSKQPVVHRLVLGVSNDGESYRLFDTVKECDDANFKITDWNCFEAQNWIEYLDGKSIEYCHHASCY